MKSNYMKSAELKIAKNPDMNWAEAWMLKNEARRKEFKLKEKLGLVRSIYAPADQYATSNGFNASRYFLDEFIYEPYEPTAELTRENLQRLIESVRATTAQEPTFIRTRDTLDTMTYYNRYVDTFPRYFNVMPTFIDTDIEFNF